MRAVRIAINEKDHGHVPVSETISKVTAVKNEGIFSSFHEIRCDLYRQKTLYEHPVFRNEPFQRRYAPGPSPTYHFPLLRMVALVW